MQIQKWPSRTHSRERDWACREFAGDQCRMARRREFPGLRRSNSHSASSVRKCRHAPGSVLFPVGSETTSTLALSGPPKPMAVKRTSLEPGKTCGHLGSVDSFVRSDMTVGGPLEPGMRQRVFPVAAIMLPSSPQLAPIRLFESHKIVGEPASTGVFFSLPDAQKPIQRPSGEERGRRAFRSRQLRRAGLIEPACGQARDALRVKRDIGQPLSVGRKDYVRADLRADLSSRLQLDIKLHHGRFRRTREML